MPKRNKKHFRFLPTLGSSSNNKSTKESVYRSAEDHDLSVQSKQKPVTSSERTQQAGAEKNPSVDDSLGIHLRQMPGKPRSSRTNFLTQKEDQTSRQSKACLERSASAGKERTKPWSSHTTSPTKKETWKTSTAEKNENTLIATLQSTNNLPKERQRIATINKQATVNVEHSCKKMSEPNANIPGENVSLLMQPVDDGGNADDKDARTVSPCGFFVVKTAHFLFQGSDQIADTTRLNNTVDELQEILLEDPNCKWISPNLMSL